MGNYIYYGYTFSRSTIISEPAVKIVEAIPEIVNHEEAITAPVVEVPEVPEVQEPEVQEVQEPEVQEEEVKEQEEEVKEQEEAPIVHPYLLEYGTTAISSNTVVIQQQTYEIRKRKNKKD